jgi:hypothetical protein
MSRNAMVARDGRVRDKDERCWEMFGGEWMRVLAVF